MKKKIIPILLVILLLICSCSLPGCSSNKKIYEQAFELAKGHHFTEARELFSMLPADYEPDSSSPDAGTWIEGIDKYVDSPFIGTWQNGNYIIEIVLKVSIYSGVHLEYEKEYTSPGGIFLWDYGYVGIKDDGKSAYYYWSKESNAKNYTLILINNKSMEVWFDGLSGDEREVILYKQ